MKRAKEDELFANKVGFASYLVNNPELFRKLRGKKALAAAMIVDLLAYKHSYAKINKELNKKNLVYKGTFNQFYNYLDIDLICKTLTILTKQSIIYKEKDDSFTISPEIYQYLQVLNCNKNNKNNKISKISNTEHSQPNLADFSFFSLIERDVNKISKDYDSYEEEEEEEDCMLLLESIFDASKFRKSTTNDLLKFSDYIVDAFKEIGLGEFKTRVLWT